MNSKEILNKVNVTDIFPDAKKSGRTWKMSCPFHAETEPSFTIYPEEGKYYCFGCGEHGNYIDYLIKTGQAKDFKEAITYLGILAGIEVKFNGTGKYKEFYELNLKIAQYFQNKLNNQDIFNLNLNKETVKNFLLGYAPKGYSRDLINLGISKEYLTELGLLNEEGKETFAERVIIPVIEYGLVKGFAGRTLQEQEPKYLNTRTTAIYEKAKTLYGLNPEEIQKKKYAIIVEGYKDCLILHDKGFKNTVATCMCHITEHQIQKLKKITNKVLILFDGDEAGQNGTVKSAKQLIANGFTVKVGILPEGIDPYDYIDSGGDIRDIFKGAEIGEKYLLKRVTTWEDKFLLLNSISSKFSIPDLVEFTNSIQDAELRDLFEEVQARKIFEKFLKETGKLIYKKDNVEILRWFNYLIVYKNKKFQFLVESSDIVEDKKKIAHLMEALNDNTNIL